jgi:hypothetical protein
MRDTHYLSVLEFGMKTIWRHVWWIEDVHESGEKRDVYRAWYQIFVVFGIMS